VCTFTSSLARVRSRSFRIDSVLQMCQNPAVAESSREAPASRRRVRRRVGARITSPRWRPGVDHQASGAGKRQGLPVHQDSCTTQEANGGHCCVSRSQAEVNRSLGPVSDHEGQFVEGFGKSSGRRYVDSEIVEASAEVLDEGMARDDDPGGTVAL
jgi:hypothetical protein